MIHNIIRYINKKRCLKSAVWKNGYLTCPKCGRVLALRYRMDGNMCVFVYNEYKQFELDILKRKNEEVNGKADLAGDVDFSEFSELILDTKLDTYENTSYIVEEGNQNLEIA